MIAWAKKSLPVNLLGILKVKLQPVFSINEKGNSRDMLSHHYN